MISDGAPGEQATVINRNSTGSMGTPKLHRLLLAECSIAESIIRSIVNQSFATGNAKPSLDESPLKPWIIEMAKTLIIYRTKTTSCGLTVQSGEGILLKRQPSPHPTLIKVRLSSWLSQALPPCFVPHPLFVHVPVERTIVYSDKEQGSRPALRLADSERVCCVHDEAAGGYAVAGWQWTGRGRYGEKVWLANAARHRICHVLRRWI